jgi:phage tail sheath protein FI
MHSWTAHADGTAQSRAPGVYFHFAVREPVAGFRTGRPAFIGRPHSSRLREPHPGVQIHRLSEWDDFTSIVGAPPSEGSFLAHAVRGFFENGGEQCVVVTCSVDHWPALLDDDSLDKASVLSAIDDIDLVCAPDLVKETADQRVVLQRQLLAHCDRLRDRFAILDAPRDATPADAARQWNELASLNGALYFPWVLPPRRSRRGTHEGKDLWVPPCGHIAGVYARTDRRMGVHKAPANELLEGVVDIRVRLSDEEQGVLNHVGVNCLRVLPGRGIRIWGARTLSGQAEWRYVNVRRLFITLRRWMESRCRDLVFDSNDPQLWNRISDRLTEYCYALYQNGALKGETPEEAYYVKCDAETNPAAELAVGRVTAEIGLAATRPAEFIVVRITQEAASGSTERTPTIRDRS